MLFIDNIKYNFNLHSPASSIMSLVQNEYFKVVLLGANYVGKTTLVERLEHDRFRSDTLVNLGTVYSTKQVTLKNHKIKTLGLFDTMGCERALEMNRFAYRGAKAVIVCYDVTNKNSFNEVIFWMDELHQNEKNALLFICGCKADLLVAAPPHRQLRIMDPSEVRTFADSHNAKFFETSSKTGENVANMLSVIAEDLYRASLGQFEEVSGTMYLSAPPSTVGKSTLQSKKRTIHLSQIQAEKDDIFPL